MRSSLATPAGLLHRPFPICLFECLSWLRNRTLFLVTFFAFALDATAGALDDFLLSRADPDTEILRQRISHWLEALSTTSKSEERGIAVANLQLQAWHLLDIPEGTLAATELIELWVLPNHATLRNQPRTSACSWENVIGGVYAFYKRADDKRGQAKVLELISLQSRDPGSRDLAILRLAALKAETGNLQEAVIIASKADARGEFTKQRADMIKFWKEKLKEQRVLE